MMSKRHIRAANDPPALYLGVTVAGVRRYFLTRSAVRGPLQKRWACLPCLLILLVTTLHVSTLTHSISGESNTYLL